MEFCQLKKENRLEYLKLMKNFRQLDENMPKEKFDEIYEKIFSTGTVIVCKINEKIVASITIIIEHKFINNCAKYGHIEDVFVDENFRNKKIGKKIVEEAIKYCNEKECFKICLICREELEAFYSLNGFENRNISMTQLI